jgi:hypothetical protein
MDKAEEAYQRGHAAGIRWAATAQGNQLQRLRNAGTGPFETLTNPFWQLVYHVWMTPWTADVDFTNTLEFWNRQMGEPRPNDTVRGFLDGASKTHRPKG